MLSYSWPSNIRLVLFKSLSKYVFVAKGEELLIGRCIIAVEIVSDEFGRIVGGPIFF